MKEGQIASSDGRSTLRHYRAEMEQTPRAVMQVVHGVSEYFLRYEDFAHHMAQRGVCIVGHDHLGHGKSATPDEYGYFGSRDGWRFLSDDVGVIRTLTRERYPDIPYFMLGHSMGSFILRDYIAAHGEGLQGVLLTGTSGRHPLTPLGQAMARVLRLWKGERFRSSFMQTMVFGGNNRRIGSPSNLYEWLSSDRSVSESYVDDPQCGFVLTLAGFQDLFMLLQRVSNAKWATQVPKDVPIVLLSGKDDPVGGYGKGPEEVVGRLKRAGHEAVSLRLYENMRHEVLNERNKDIVYRDVEAFIEDQVRAT